MNIYRRLRRLFRKWILGKERANRHLDYCFWRAYNSGTALIVGGNEDFREAWERNRKQYDRAARLAS